MSMTEYAEYVIRNDGTYTAFVNQIRVYQGPYGFAPETVRKYLEDTGLLAQMSHQQIILFDDVTGKQEDLNVYQRALDTAVNNLHNAKQAADRRKVGRPKLGVVSREVSLLPRHWEWLEGQRGGASAALRRLIDEARKADPAGERRRQTTEAAGRFMTVMAGDLPGYEEASRALYAHNPERLQIQMAGWPEAVQSHILYLLDPPFHLQG